MLRWALAFFVIAIIAALLGFGGIAAAAAGIARIIFFIFLVLCLVALLSGLMRRAYPSAIVSFDPRRDLGVSRPLRD